MSPVARSLAVPLVLLTGLGMGVVAPQRPASIAPPPELLARWQRTDRLREVMRRANQLRPQRRDFPARYENIGDVEVREIERMAVKFVPRALVNIGTVVTGCACEEGPDCTDQVWIVASNPEKSHGLQMSRINKRWVVGEVQQWWL